MKNSQVKNFLLLLLLSSLWGPSFLFIKVAVEYVEPFTITTFRVGVASLLLYTVLKFKKINLPKFGLIWKHFAVMAIFGSGLPFALFNIGEQYVSSSLAAILNGTVPLFTLIIAHFATKNDRLTKAKFYGAIIGFVGLLILVLPSLIGVKATFFGIIAILAATASYAIGFVYSKKYIIGIKPLVASTSQLFLATLFLLPLALIFENPSSIISAPNKAILSILGLSILGTAFAFILFYKIMDLTSATYVSMVNYMVPIFGVILGIVVLGERLSWNSALGCLVILMGVMIANGVFTKIKFKHN
jgi:drug/metabolite transporter (DMT)-like permease